VRSQVLTATRMKTTVFWDFAPSSLIEVGRHFREIALMMEAVDTSETSPDLFQTTQCNNREDSRLRETLVSYRVTGLRNLHTFLRRNFLCVHHRKTWQPRKVNI
jgi:hypothetical protein